MSGSSGAGAVHNLVIVRRLLREGFAPENVRPPQKAIMRIYRDIRFSPDKRPYKHQQGAWWARTGLEKTSGGGFYFHVGGSELVIAAGLL